MVKLVYISILLFFTSCANVVIQLDSNEMNTSSALYLKNILLPDGISLDTDVKPDVEEYNCVVPIAYSSLNAIPVPNISEATVSISKDGIVKSNISDFPLSVGDNIFEIVLSWQELTARYYLNVTKWKQLDNYIKPDIPVSAQKFGWHLSMHGNYLAVGAPEEDTVAGTKAGAVYVFKHENGDWIQKARITAPNADADDWFGHSVYIYNDYLLVGAPHEDSTASGIFTDTSSDNNSGTEVGAAYLFKRDSNDNWTLQYYIKPHDPASWSVFGWSVALDKTDGETLLVNAPWDSQGAGYSGAVYVFNYSSGNLTEEAKLKSDAPTYGTVFGGSIYVKDKRVVVGAPYEDIGASNSGSVYIFEQVSGVWTQRAKLFASNPSNDDYFGWAVVSYDDTILVGAPNEDSDPSVGLNDNSLPNSGIVYEFKYDGSAWNQTAYFKAFNAGADDQFGWNMDFDTNSVVIGAPGEDGSGRGINPSDDDLSSNSGAAYVFKKDLNGTWVQDSYIKATNSDAGDKFGHSVVIDAGRLVIVSSDEQSLDPDDPDNNAGTGAGAVYYYE